MASVNRWNDRVRLAASQHAGRLAAFGVVLALGKSKGAVALTALTARSEIKLSAIQAEAGIDRWKHKSGSVPRYDNFQGTRCSEKMLREPGGCHRNVTAGYQESPGDTRESCDVCL